MRQVFRYFLAGLCALLMANQFPTSTAAAKDKEPACGDFGTQVHFEKTPSDAAKKALKEQKLVCVLHVSGDFENTDFT